MPKLMSLYEAAARGIERVRDPQYQLPEDHFKIDIIDGKPGPWLHLYSTFNKECNGRDPVDVLIITCDPDKRCLVSYTGPLPDSAEYKAAEAAFARPKKAG